MSDGEAATPSTETAREEDHGGALDEFDAERATTILRWVGVAVLAITAAVALSGFYNGVNGTIRVWVSDPYQPAFRAAFNLALLLVALGGIGLLLRRAD